MKHIIISIGALLMFSFFNTSAQVGINTDSSIPDNSAMLDVKSSTRGFLPPRMSHAELNAISSPADGLVVYCTDCVQHTMGYGGGLSMFISGAWYTLGVNCLVPLSPVSGLHVPSLTQIVWNWNGVSWATGYKWNTINDYASATDLGPSISTTETGLTCSTVYSRYVWAYNGCGPSPSVLLTQMALSCPCGPSIIINHIAGVVAPVNKTVTYGTVTNIPGEDSKCWITSNLGADHQATSVNDNTEASAGWYWQFNRKQGYKLDDNGTTRTPNSAWINFISEDSEWAPVNDPCSIELGAIWRLPTFTEWTNVDASGNWTNWNGPWNSGLKMHTAGGLGNTNGVLNSRGYAGFYWSSTQSGLLFSWNFGFSSAGSGMYNNNKASGFTLRCIRN